MDKNEATVFFYIAAYYIPLMIPSSIVWVGMFWWAYSIEGLIKFFRRTGALISYGYGKEDE